MNLDETEKATPPEETPKKLSRKEKKALKRAEKEAAKAAKQTKKTMEELPSDPVEVPEMDTEVDAELEPAPVPDIPPTTYSAWEKISPPAKRKKQLATMESGYKEVLALVHSMRENQEVLMQSFQKLPEAVDSVKKLADHSAKQSDILSAMNEQLESGSAGKFNETLTSMDKTTQLLLERAQRSEERLYGMLRRAQRRIAFMTLLVLLLFLGTGAAILFLAFPEQTRGWLTEKGWVSSGTERVEEPTPVEEPLPTPVTEEVLMEEDTLSEEPDLIPEAIVEDVEESLPPLSEEITEPTEVSEPETDLVTEPASEESAPLPTEEPPEEEIEDSPEESQEGAS